MYSILYVYVTSMKIRIARNSIRFRLKQAEVESFSKRNSITEMVEFGISPQDRLSFTLEQAEGDAFAITLTDHAITLRVPAQLAAKWTGTEMVGFEESVDTGKGKTVKVLVEKDFACLDKGEAENEGTYPNPKTVC